MDFEDCVKRNLLKEQSSATGWVENEIKTAEKFREQAGIILEAGQYESAEVISYAAIFHLARAILYSRGYSEKSHYCLFVAVSSIHGSKVKEICTKAQHLREARHNVIYGGKDITKAEAEHAVNLVEEFKSITGEILQNSE